VRLAEYSFGKGLVDDVDLHRLVITSGGH